MSGLSIFLQDIRGRELICDVDGVLANTKEAALHASGSPLHPDQLERYEIMSYLSEAEQERLHACWADAEWWRAVPVMAGAKEAFENIQACAKHVLLATRPWLACVGWESARRAWLLEHFGVHHDDVAIIGPKERIAGDVILEDMPENLERFVSRQRPPAIFGTSFGWLYDHAYNKAYPWPHRLTWPI